MVSSYKACGCVVPGHSRGAKFLCSRLMVGFHAKPLVHWEFGVNLVLRDCSVCINGSLWYTQLASVFATSFAGVQIPIFFAPATSHCVCNMPGAGPPGYLGRFILCIIFMVMGLEKLHDPAAVVGMPEPVLFFPRTRGFAGSNSLCRAVSWVLLFDSQWTCESEYACAMAIGASGAEMGCLGCPMPQGSGWGQDR